jgi:hypothetical protein
MTTYKEIFGKPIKVLTGDPAPTPVSFTVTASGGAFYIDGVLQKTLELYEGNTYIFTYPSAHPFRFATAADAAGSTEYTTGVTVDSSTQITIVVASGAPTLFYYCTNHNNMGGRALTPASPSEYEGQIWYNETTGKFRSIVASIAWSNGGSTGNLTNNGAGAGTQTAGLTFGGRNPPGPAFVAATEEYNGSGWSSGGALNTARSYLAGFGIQTAAVAAGGRINAPGTSTNATEEYNGSAWTTVNNMGTGRRVGGSAGIVQTAGLAIGGGPPAVTSNEEYDGTNWTAGGSLNTARFYLGGFGTQTSAVAAGGNGGESAVEEYDGSSWTTVTSLGTGRTQLGSSGSSETDGLVFGGEAPGPAVKADTETYDGTSWTEVANLATARRGLSGSCGNSGKTALATAGFPTYNLTEEFTNSANVITAGAYSALTSANNVRDVEGFGSKNGSTTSAYIGNGGTPPNGMSQFTEDWNGSSWTNSGNYPVNCRHVGGSGIETAGIGTGGFDGPSNLNGTNEYDGSSWTGGGNYPVAQYAVSVAGTQTAAIGQGGGSDTTPSNDYNGSSWTSNPAMSQGRSWFGTSGSQTATLAVGGAAASGGLCEEFNGSSWTAGGTLVTGTTGTTTGTAGTQAATVLFGGGNPGVPGTPFSFQQTYDGSSWVTGPAMGTARNNASVSGTTTSHMASCGGFNNNVEQFTPGSTAANKKNITTS